jgi:hypothetical protein
MMLDRPTPVPVRGAQAGRRNVLLVSSHNIRSRPWGGVTWEFLDVVSRIETGAVVAPGRLAYGAPLRALSDELAPLLYRIADMARGGLGLPSARFGARAAIEGSFDLCFYACQFAREIGEIDNVPDWRRRSRIACAFILETWPGTIAKDRADYRLLDRFDMVFVLNAASIPLIAAYTSTPVVFLPTAADTLMLPAAAFARERVIDLLCIGRRKGSVHAAVMEHAEATGKLYLYDVWAEMQVRDWRAVRQQNAAMAARARFYFVWSPARGGGEALSTRYFEGAAGGAVLLGSRPDLPEFGELFDWPDAVIELPEAPAAVGGFLDGLEADPARLARIRWRNRREALLRHDWAHRWAAVLDALGLERTAAHAGRLATLAERAEAEAACFQPPAVPRPSGWRRLAEAGLGYAPLPAPGSGSGPRAAPGG